MIHGQSCIIMSVNGDTMIWHCIILLPNCNIFFYKFEHSSRKWYNKERTYKRRMCHGQSWLYTAACKVIVRNQCTHKRPLKVNVTEDRIKRRSERYLWWWFNMTPFTLQTATLVWIACWKWGILQITVMFSDWQIHFIPLTTSPIDETIQSGSWTPLCEHQH